MSAGKVIGAAVALLIVAVLAMLIHGQWRWRTLTQTLTGRLEAARLPPASARSDGAGLDALPPVVQRYFRTALPDSPRIITAVSVEHAGTFNMGESVDQWKPFTSQQRVITRRPGFVWDARVRLLPAVNVHVHDAYVAGEGILRPSILGVFTLADLHGTDDIARGELMRYFAESAWYPTALLPDQGVQWAPVDDRSARATLTDGAITLTLTFTFDPDGLIGSVRADARGRTEHGAIVMRPWEGRWSNYQVRDGMRVPLNGEVAWLLPEDQGGRKVYWRGAITSLRYEFAQ